MSSGFVSGGTADKPIKRDDEWLKAQQEIEANRLRKEEESQQQGGKTLYEILQGNKGDLTDCLGQEFYDAEAFEESIKLKNQFRNLDEDEIEFLDSVLESTRAKEEAVKKETKEQLDLFRRQQEEADKAAPEEGGITEEGVGEGKAGSPTLEETTWAVNGKKRKRAKEKEVLKGVKLRKSSSTAETSKELSPISLEVDKKKAVTSIDNTSENAIGACPTAETSKSPAETVAATPEQPGKAPATNSKEANTKFASTAGLGLAGYSSDEDD